jgi:hypothetical protein
MTDPDILFHRCLQTRVPFQSRRFFGCAELDKLNLDPIFVDLLIGFKTMFNEVLTLAHSTASTPAISYPIHFDYVDSREANAIAIRCHQLGFIGVTVPYVQDAWAAISIIAAGSNTPALLRLAADHESRERLAAALLRLHMTYLVSHEYAHHLNGDVDEDGLFIEHDGTMKGNLSSQAKERHADGVAVFLCLRILMAREERGFILQLVGYKALDEMGADELLIALLILAIGARMYHRAPIVLDEKTSYAATHPAAAARMNFIMHGMSQWCEQNRASLREKLTLALFQKLMRGIDQALAGGKNDRWAQQNSFLKSPKGINYLNELQSALNKRLKGEA